MSNTKSSFHLFSRYKKLLKIVNLYEHQIEVLDKMLDEFSAKYMKCAVSTEKVQFHKAFAEKQKSIAELKNALKSSSFPNTKEKNEKTNDRILGSEDLNNRLEEDVVNIEKEVKELSKEFKDYLVEKL